jgi:outer membrane protein assembly factor BamB
MNYAFFALFLTNKLLYSQTADDWIHSRGDEAMTGTSPMVLKYPLKPAWQFKTMEKSKGQVEMLVSSAVVRGEKVYVGCKDRKFYCIDLATGNAIWKEVAQGAFDGVAVFAGDLVVAGGQDAFVYVWNAETGKEVWSFESDDEIHAAANVWTDPDSKSQHIIIGSYVHNLYSLDAKTGKKEWSAETGNNMVFGACDNTVYIHDARTGRKQTEIDVGAPVGNNVVAADGIIYFAHYGNRVGAYSIAGGQLVWEYGEREFEFYAAPSICERTVFVVGRDKRFLAIDCDSGKLKWEFRARDCIDSSALACGGKSVIFGCDDGYI